MRLLPAAADRVVPPSLWALVAANLLPLAGVLLFRWDLDAILLLYWAESAVILLFSLAKLARTEGAAAAFLIPFFLVHAGMFMAGHLLFLSLLFLERPAEGWGGLARDVGLGLAAFLASHAYSYSANVRRRGEAYGGPKDVMGAFYSRIVVMHLTILGGGWIVLALGQPAGALLLLVVLKTAADALAHLRERRRHPPSPAPAGTGPTSPS